MRSIIMRMKFLYKRNEVLSNKNVTLQNYYYERQI